MSDKAKMIEWLDAHCCSNHNCDIRYSPIGMGTNAMCSCVRDAVERGDHNYLRQAIWYKNALADDRIKELDSLLKGKCPMCGEDLPSSCYGQSVCCMDCGYILERGEGGDE